MGYYDRVRTKNFYDSYGKLERTVHREYQVQRRPYVYPLFFNSVDQFRTGWLNSFPGSTPQDVTTVTVQVNMGDHDLVLAQNRAYAKLQDQIKASAQNANNLLESGQNISSVVNKVKAISKAYSQVKKGDIAGAAKSLGVTVSGKKADKIKNRAKQASDAWLELHFGWVPLVKDIGASMDAISPPPGSPSGTFKKRVRAGAAVSGSDSYHLDTVGPRIDSRDIRYYNWFCGCRMGGYVYVTNPNVALANQMGFVNPLSVAWEAIPFSFLVDWFSNVGQVLGACSDMWGYQTVNAYGTNFQKGQIKLNFDLTDKEDHTQSFYREDSACVVHIGREDGFTGPHLTFSIPHGLSASRGATAISLLVQNFLK